MHARDQHTHREEGPPKGDDSPRGLSKARVHAEGPPKGGDDEGDNRRVSKTTREKRPRDQQSRHEEGPPKGEESHKGPTGESVAASHATKDGGNGHANPPLPVKYNPLEDPKRSLTENERKCLQVVQIADNPAHLILPEATVNDELGPDNMKYWFLWKNQPLPPVMVFGVTLFCKINCVGDFRPTVEVLPDGTRLSPIYMDTASHSVQLALIRPGQVNFPLPLIPGATELNYPHPEQSEEQKVVALHVARLMREFLIKFALPGNQKRWPELQKAADQMVQDPRAEGDVLNAIRKYQEASGINAELFKDLQWKAAAVIYDTYSRRVAGFNRGIKAKVGDNATVRITGFSAKSRVMNIDEKTREFINKSKDKSGVSAAEREEFLKSHRIPPVIETLVGKCNQPVVEFMKEYPGTFPNRLNFWEPKHKLSPTDIPWAEIPKFRVMQDPRTGIQDVIPFNIPRNTVAVVSISFYPYNFIRSGTVYNKDKQQIDIGEPSIGFSCYLDWKRHHRIVDFPVEFVDASDDVDVNDNDDVDVGANKMTLSELRTLEAYRRRLAAESSDSAAAEIKRVKPAEQPASLAGSASLAAKPAEQPAPLADSTLPTVKPVEQPTPVVAVTMPPAMSDNYVQVPLVGEDISSTGK